MTAKLHPIYVVVIGMPEAERELALADARAKAERDFPGGGFVIYVIGTEEDYAYHISKDVV